MCSTVGHLFSVIVSKLNVLILLPIFLVINVTITASNNSPFCSRIHIKGSNGLFHVLGFHDVYGSTSSPRGVTRILTLGRVNNPMFGVGGSPHIAGINHFVHHADLSRLPRLFGVFINSVAVMKPHPPLRHRISRCASCRGRHLLIGRNLAYC